MEKNPKSSPSPNNPPMPGDTVRELFHEKRDEFMEALECLYIRGNQGGRVMFAEKWPAASKAIFSDQLLDYDYNGVSDEADRAERARLELEAIDAWNALLVNLSDLEAKLVQHGSLNIPELEKTMALLERPLAQYIFAGRFVDRFHPVKSPDTAAAGAAVSAAEMPPEPAVSQPVAAGGTASASAPHVAGQAPTSASADTHPASSNTASQAAVDSGATPHHVPGDEMGIPKPSVRAIGHVDHSFDASMPHYAEDSEDGEGEDMSWLDRLAEEDDLGGVGPIETGVGAEAGMGAGVLPEAPIRPQSSVSSSAIPVLPGDLPAAPSTEDGMTQTIQFTARGSAPSAPHSAASPSPAVAPVSAPVMDAPAQVARPVSTVSGRVGASSSGRLPMGLRAAQAQHDAEQAVADTRRDGAVDTLSPVTEQGAEMPAAKAEERAEPRMPQGEEERKPRVPSLDDLDKHMPPSRVNAPRSGGFPPIPGSDESDF